MGNVFHPQTIATESPPIFNTKNITEGLFCADIIERCDEKPLWNALMGYGFLVVFCFALIGNCLNLLIYNSDHIRFFIAIRMLCTKLLMNTCMMMVMLPQALRVIRLWDIGDRTDQLYWRFWPYQAYLTNVFGFCAMWLTVLMTAECYIHIFFPSKSKLLCTKQTVWRSYFIILLTGLILASIYPLNRDVSLVNKCDRKVVKIITSQSSIMILFEKIHTIADMFLSILLPLSLLVFMTIMIVWRLWIWPNRRWRHLKTNDITKKPPNQTGPTTNLLTNAAYNERKSRENGSSNGNNNNNNHFSAEKRGVTRITLITCFIQLVTETPSMSVLIYVSMFGPNVHKKEHVCTLQTISYFLCLCNASLSFFVYITFSNRFRKTMINRVRLLLHRVCPTIFSEVPPSTGGLKNYGRQMRMPNSSATPSQMVVLTSRDNSPRNGSQSEGKHQKLLVVVSEPKNSGKKSRAASITTKDVEEGRGRCSPSSKLSSRNSSEHEIDKQKLQQHFSNFPISFTRRFLRDKLVKQTKEKGPLKKLESDSLMTETTNSMETIPASLSGHHLAFHNNSVDSCRPLSNSVNGRLTGNNQIEQQILKKKDCCNGELSNNLRRKTSSANEVTGIKRSSICSTNTNSQFDAFL
ncbi:unnamed protein product [Meloidogyne enterolobii]|uniref:Uncharacterized protein n=1 Tax=Meloidogyne enterolobii TaxID=390850 RepID=A0ACB0YJF1_MELEN